MIRKEDSEHGVKLNGSSDAQNTPVEENKGESGNGTEVTENKKNESGREKETSSSVVSPAGRPSNPVVVLIDDDEVDLFDEEDSQQEEASPQGIEPNKDETSPKEPTVSNQTSFGRSRKRRRRVAVVAADAQDRPLLPPNQYETVLRRRAICKPGDEETKVDGSPTSSVKSLFSTKSHEQEHESDDGTMEGYDEEFGDISVGMKLNIIGGKVIVQRVNTLSDGRASPAQLTGLIQRGDVLLSLDNVSLVNLPLDQLLTGLKPLSDPHHGNCYKRSLRLRFAAGEGLKLLQKNETMKKPSADPTFALSQYVTFVDQLSGAPMFESGPIIPIQEAKESVIASRAKEIEPVSPLHKGMSMNQIISFDVADYRKMETQKYTSDFFMENERVSEILRASAILLSHEYAEGRVPLTFSEMMESGERAMVGAKALFHNLENFDKGKDTRSFNTWNSTLSLRSRASARRRYVMKNVIQHEVPLEEEEPSDLESVGSSASGDASEPTGDELLLQLAAHDEIWRRNVIEVLRNAAKEIEEGEQKQEEPEKAIGNEPASNGAPQTLESLLFGSKVSKMLTSKKRSHALPPEDVTSVLFDLMTNLTVTPDEISLNESNHHVRLKPAAFVPFRERHSRGNDNTMFAAQFLISDALPAWLKSFRPLPWEQRRVLWPKIHSTSGTSLASASYNIPDDGLTVDSSTTGYPSPNRQYRKDLRQQIEDMELNAETRAETCVLVTFYFTQQLLPSLAVVGVEGAPRSARIDEAIEFVKMFGAYLRLHLCLVSAAMVKADAIIDELLALSKFDPRHREVTKELAKSTNLVLYDPTMLSAILARLNGICTEPKSNRRHDMMNICVLAYPDLLPWQVRQACLGKDTISADDRPAVETEFHEMYYEYLSLLLHPWEGQDAARQNAELVTEWCQLSLQSLSREGKIKEAGRDKERRNNFRRVVSRTSSEHGFYRRDLFSLMNLSVNGNERDLALDLVDEMLDSPAYCNDKAVLSGNLDVLRTMAKDALSLQNSPTSGMNDLVLRRIFKLFEKMATNKSAVCRESIDVSAELFSLLQSRQTGSTSPSEAELFFMNLLAHHGAPVYALQTLALWAPGCQSSSDLMPLLHILLQRGTHDGISREISGSLLRVRYARAQSKGNGQTNVAGLTLETTAASDNNVWKRMFDGSVTIAK